MGPPALASRAERDRRQVPHRAQRPPGDPERADQEPVGRQPAEGAARPLAGDAARHAHPRRADPRHRRRREGRDPGGGRRARRRRRRRGVHLVGARRGRSAQRSDRRPEGPPQDRRDRTVRSHREHRRPSPRRWSTVIAERRCRHDAPRSSGPARACCARQHIWAVAAIVGCCCCINVAQGPGLPRHHGQLEHRRPRRATSSTSPAPAPRC